MAGEVEAVVATEGADIKDRLCVCGHNKKQHNPMYETAWCLICECEIYVWEGDIWP